MPRASLWTEIEETLTAELAEGRYPPGAKLPSEARLAERFGVNRHTVRRALAEMQGNGLVHARRGAGVFVTAQPTRYAIGRRVSFRRNLEAAGRRGSGRILSLETAPGAPADCAALGLAEGALVHVLDSLSFADDAPMGLGRSVFPAERFPELPAHLRLETGITRAFAACGLHDYFRRTTEVIAEPASAIVAGHLHIPAGSPVLVTEATNVDPNGAPVEFGRTHFVADRVRLVFGEDDDRT